MDIRVPSTGPTHLGDILGKSGGRPLPCDLRSLLRKGGSNGQGWEPIQSS